METIDCHDCGNFVSFSAIRCPHCGSSEPSGPYRMSAKEARRHRAEYRNDKRLAATALTFAFLGGAYGFATSTGMFGAIFWVSAYSLFGLLVGIPVGAALNILRW
jgi:hypothetical protein